MATDQIKMNGAAFVRSFVLSYSLEGFISYGIQSGAYYQAGEKQIDMLTEVWNIAHSKKSVYKPQITGDPIMPKPIKVTKKGK